MKREFVFACWFAFKWGLFNKGKVTDTLFQHLAPFWKEYVIQHRYTPFANLHPEPESMEPLHICPTQNKSMYTKVFFSQKKINSEHKGQLNDLETNCVWKSPSLLVVALVIAKSEFLGWIAC